MIRFLPLPKASKRSDVRVRDAIHRETKECLAKDVRGEDYTPPARFAPPIDGNQSEEPVQPPWHTYDRD